MKRQQRDRRTTQRQREKQRMEETMKELHELMEQLEKEQELAYRRRNHSKNRYIMGHNMHK